MFGINPVFLCVSAAAILAPGPDILYTVARGISNGRKASIVAAAGFACGLSVHTSLAVFGLSAILLASAWAFTCVKILGAGYLVYLGIRAWGSQGLVSLPKTGEKPGAKRIYAQAFLMNVLNPKVALFYLAFLPQFTRPELGHLARQFFTLGLCFAILTFVIFSTVGICSSIVGRKMTEKPRLMRFMDRTVGTLFIGLGIKLAFTGAK